MAYDPNVLGSRFDPTEDMNWKDKFIAGAGQGFMQPYYAMRQKLGLDPQSVVNERLALDRPLMSHGAAQLGNLAANIGMSIPITAGTGALAAGAARMFPAAAAAVPGWAARAAMSPLGQAAGQGALGGFLSQNAEGESTLGNMLAGAGIGAGLYGAGAGLTRLGTNLFREVGNRIPESTRAWAERGKNIVGSYLPSFAYTQRPGTMAANAMFGSLPGSGSQSGAALQAQKDYTRAVSKLVGQDSENLTEAVPAGYREVGKVFDELNDKYPITAKVQLGPAKKALQAVEAAPEVSGTAPEAAAVNIAKRLDQHHNDILGYQATDTFDGATYRDLRGKLEALAQKSRKAGFDEGQDAARTMRKALDEAWNKSVVVNGTPEDVARNAEANRMYRTLKVLQPDKNSLEGAIYDGKSGLIDFDALYNRLSQDPYSAPMITSNKAMPSGNPNPMVDVTNLGVSPGYEKMSQVLGKKPSTLGHVAGTIPAGAGALVAYELMPEDLKEKPSEAIPLALALSLGAYGAGSLGGRFLHSPASTEGLGRYVMGPTAARYVDPVVGELFHNLPFAGMPALHAHGRAAPSAAPGTSTVPEEGWSLGEPVPEEPPAPGAAPGAGWSLGDRVP